MSSPSSSLGWNPIGPFSPNSLQSLLSEAQNNAFSFISVPIQTCPNFESAKLDDLASLMKWQKTLLASSDRSLFDSNDWSNRILFRISSNDLNIQNLLDYAAHMTVFAVLISSDWTVKSILDILELDSEKGFPFKIYISCGLEDWEKLLELKNYLSNDQIMKIGIVPSISSKSLLKLDLFDLWKCENIKSILITDDVFLENRNGYPVLPRVLQACLMNLRRVLDYPLIVSSDGPENFATYLRWLFDPQRDENKLSEEEELMRGFAEGFENVLQTPLQPLKDNLPSETYEVFERDPVKYARYELAIEAALKDLLKSPNNYNDGVNHEEEDDDDFGLKIGVFGAGRGPLVQCTLNALEKVSHDRVEIFVIEKSPNACLTLLDRFRAFPSVKIIFGDMRDQLNVPKSFDLIISELLGSFGDNELSPECLRPVEGLLKANKGIMIPQEYTSYIQPCYSPILWSQVEEIQKISVLKGDAFDYNYVVRVTRAFFPSKKPKPVFTFKHPFDENVFNAEIKIAFEDLIKVPVDGFIGYFECKLYDEIFISTIPENIHSPGMLSWFPIYFPLKNPIKQARSLINFTIKRCVGEGRIWYEWFVDNEGVEVEVEVKVKESNIYCHNVNGKSHSINC